MTDLPYSIELHDSTISGIESRDGSIIIKFSRAYVHLDGKGWAQEAEIRVCSATVGGEQVDYPAKVGDGKLVTEDGPYHNLLMLPLSTTGPVNLEIEFFSGKVVRISGTGIDVTLKGRRTLLEQVAGRL
ncbi:hypothetical protein ACFPPA_15890 [Rhodanobacter ginsengisoli]|uniref:Uncharacterized protein n=1 Tax=Rhodanobacter ginsengisoli TaxID=418646 RepID=A0ABW0QR36_9GAMM